MKHLKILILAIICLSSFMACSKKATKEEVLNFYTKVNEYVTGAEFKNVLTTQKSSKEYESALEKKMLELAQAIGFKSLEEMKASTSIMQSPEVKEALKKYEETLTKVLYSAAEGKALEDMKKAESGEVKAPEAEKTEHPKEEASKEKAEPAKEEHAKH